MIKRMIQLWALALLLLAATAISVAMFSGCSARLYKPLPPDPCRKYWHLRSAVCEYADKTEQCRIAGMKLMRCVEENEH